MCKEVKAQMVSKYIFDLDMEYLDDEQKARFIADVKDELIDLEREYEKLKDDNGN